MRRPRRAWRDGGSTSPQVGRSRSGGACRHRIATSRSAMSMTEGLKLAACGLGPCRCKLFAVAVSRANTLARFRPGASGCGLRSGRDASARPESRRARRVEPCLQVHHAIEDFELVLGERRGLWNGRGGMGSEALRWQPGRTRMREIRRKGQRPPRSRAYSGEGGNAGSAEGVGDMPDATLRWPKSGPIIEIELLSVLGAIRALKKNDMPFDGITK